MSSTLELANRCQNLIEGGVAFLRAVAHDLRVTTGKVHSQTNERFTNQIGPGAALGSGCNQLIQPL